MAGGGGGVPGSTTHFQCINAINAKILAVTASGLADLTDETACNKIHTGKKSIRLSLTKQSEDNKSGVKETTVQYSEASAAAGIFHFTYTLYIFC